MLAPTPRHCTPLHAIARHSIAQVRAARILATGDLAVVKVLKAGGMLEDGSFRLNAMLHLHEIWWVSLRA